MVSHSVSESLSPTKETDLPGRTVDRSRTGKSPSPNFQRKSSAGRTGMTRDYEDERLNGTKKKKLIVNEDG